MNDLSIQEHASWTRKEQNASSHVGVVTWAAGWVAALLLQLGFVVLVGWTCGHLGWEKTWCNGVDPNLGLGESAGHHAGEVDHCCLGRTIGELSTTAALHQTRNGSDVDDGGGVALDRRATLAEKWKDVGCEEEVGGDIGVEGVLPGGPLRLEHVLGDGVWRGHVWLGVGVLCGVLESNTGVVDEEVDAVWLLLGDLVNEGLDRGLVADIAGQSVTKVSIRHGRGTRGTYGIIFPPSEYFCATVSSAS